MTLNHCLGCNAPLELLPETLPCDVEIGDPAIAERLVQCGGCGYAQWMVWFLDRWAHVVDRAPGRGKTP